MQHQKLQAILDQIASQFPALRGQLGASQDDQAELAGEVFAHWKTAQAIAGKHYWRARSWGMLMWQPAYLSVLAVHCADTALDLRGLWQFSSAGVTTGFMLPQQPIQHGAASDIIPIAAQSLRHYHQQQHAHLCAIQAYSAKQAACMSVDCVLSALLLAHQRHGWREEVLTQYVAHWLGALQWQRHGNVMHIPLNCSSTAPALNRQGCCQHFRLPGEEPCSTCPRWPMPVRIEKIRRELMTV